MDFIISPTKNNMFMVSKDLDGGCEPFTVTFPTLEQAEQFVIKILILNGNLPSTMKGHEVWINLN